MWTAGEGDKPSACRRLGVYLGTWVNRVVVENRILCCTTVPDRCTVCWMLGKMRLLGSGKKHVTRSLTRLTGTSSVLPRGQMKACSPCVCTHVPWVHMDLRVRYADTHAMGTRVCTCAGTCVPASLHVPLLAYHWEFRADRVLLSSRSERPPWPAGREGGSR